MGDRRGKRHWWFHSLASHADPATGLLRICILGRTLIVACTPRAQHELVKQSYYMPKSPLVYRVFRLLVCP